ncbi:MAG: zinc-binding dehydrogenase, partial [Actinomycetota bacterium]
RMSADGVVVSFGNSSNEPTSFDPRVFYRKGAPTMLGYFVTHELLEGRIGTSRLAALAALTAEGRLSAGVSLCVPWDEAAGAIDGLMDRRIQGKAVLQIG